MLNYKKYLIAVDGSDHSMEAVKYASDILPKNSSEIVLFLVGTDIPETFWDIDSFPEQNIVKKKKVEDWITKQNKIFTNTLSKAKKILTDKGFSESRVHIKTQPREIGITRDIIKEASRGYSAVFAGRKGLTNIRNLTMGSVAQKLLAKLNFTTLILVGENPETQNFVIGFDASEGAKKAVKLTGEILKDTDKKIHVRHVSRSVKLIEGEYNLFFASLDPTSIPIETERIEHRKKRIDPELIKALEKLTGLGVSPSNTDSGIIEAYISRALALVETAKKNDWGTIIIGRKGVSRVQEFFIGRVGEKVVQMAPQKAVWIVSS